jgi:hypothetical protein
VTGSERRVDAALRQADGLVAAASALAIALDDLGAIELPPSSGRAADQAQIRAIAALYLASELDAAGVVANVEDLVGLARSGGVGLDFDGAVPLMERFWEGRNDRASAAERTSVFGSLFAGPFDDLLIDLCEALYKIDEQPTNASWGGVAQQARVRAASEQLLDQLAQHAGSLTVFLARDVLDTIRQSLAILKHQGVLTAFGARSVADAIAAIGRRLRRAGDGAFDQHARRGQAGMTVLAWLADAAPLLGNTGQPLVGVDHPVVAAAVDWLQTSLAITEAGAPSPSPAPAQSDPAAAPQPRRDDSWAALAG